MGFCWGYVGAIFGVGVIWGFILGLIQGYFGYVVCLGLFGVLFWCYFGVISVFVSGFGFIFVFLLLRGQLFLSVALGAPIWSQMPP